RRGRQPDDAQVVRRVSEPGPHPDVHVRRGRPGRTYTLAYDTASRVTSVQEPFGLVPTMGYDADGNRTGVRDPKGGYPARRVRLRRVGEPRRSAGVGRGGGDVARQ